MPTHKAEAVEGPITPGLYNIRVRLHPADYIALRRIAERNERKLTQEIRLAVRRHIERESA